MPETERPLKVFLCHAHADRDAVRALPQGPPGLNNFILGFRYAHTPLEGNIMTWADEIQTWKKQQEQRDKSKEWRQKFEAIAGRDSEWKKVYKSYLASPIWQEIRKRKLKQAGNRCERCHAQFITDSGLQVHHKTYDRVGGLERDSDLEVVCAGECHEEADEEREERIEAERLYADYERWFENWGAKKYQDDWVIQKYDREMDVREEFREYTYRKWCKENHKNHRSYLKIPDDFVEMLEDGRSEFCSQPAYALGLATTVGCFSRE